MDASVIMCRNGHCGFSKRHQLRMLPLFILLMMLQVVNLQLAADIYPCSDETKSGILHFSEYTHIEICCQLVEKWCYKTTFNDSLTLLPETGCNGSCISQMHREDTCLVKFEISNASSANEGVYSCRLNGETLMPANVYIIKKPPTPVIINFTCSYNNERTVTFDRGPQGKEYNDIYNITMLEGRQSPVMMCSTSQLVCKPGDRICVCKIKVSDRVNPSSNVAIYVTVNRSVQTSWASRNFTIAGNIIPGPIKLLNVSKVGPHDAQIKFCMHADTKRLCGFMSSRDAALRFHLLVYREQGTPEILNVTLPTSDKRYNCDLCRLVQLPNLIAYTNYTVIVSDSGGGGESNKSRIEFTTAETVPVYPPVVDDFGFRRLDNCSASARAYPCLIVIWKPLPHEAKGGRELSYYIEVISEDGFQINQTTVNAHAVISHQDLPPGPLTVKLWSQNVIGRTQNYTRFEIPQKSEAAVPYVLVELNGNHAFVYVNLTSQTDVPLVIQWCNSDQNKPSDFNICQNYPSTAAFSLKAATNKPFQKFKVQLITDMEFKENQYHQPINYYELFYFNSNPNIAKNATATVTKNAYHIIQDMDYYFEEDVFDPSDYSIYFNISRKRRYVSESVSSSEAKIKFSISFKKHEMPSTGMIPANCYFDAAKEKVSLTPSQFQDSSSNAVILQWVQTCETDTAQQFLADYFNVYSSADAHCTESKTYIGRINNTLFQPNVLKLPSGTKFACIQTFRRDGIPAADLKIHSVVPYTDAKTKEMTPVTVIIISVLVPTCAVVFILGIIIIRLCLKRRRRVYKYTDKSITLPTKSTLDAATHGMNCSSVSNIPEQTVPEQTDAISSNSSGDSGRGTDNESKPVNDSYTSYENDCTSSSKGPIIHRSSDKSLDCTDDLLGSGMRHDNGTLENGISSANSYEENVCSDRYHEENECSGSYEENENDDSATASERVYGSGESQQSYTDADQKEALQRKGLSFNVNSSSGNSSSSCNSSSSSNSQFSGNDDKNISSSSSSSAKSSENTHNSNCFSEQSGGNSGRKASGSSSITEDNGNCDREEENTNYSVGSNGSDRECDQQCETSFQSNSGSRCFRHFESAECFGQHFENHSPSDARYSLTVPFNRFLSSGSESEGDVEKPFIDASEVHV